MNSMITYDFMLLLDNDYNNDCETDYKIKIQNKNYQKYLNFDNQLSFKEFQNFIIKNKKQIIKEIETIKVEYLYASFTHGFNHNVKVLLFGMYLSRKLNLDEVDFRILMDACKYHDVGRTNDLYDEKHGFLSAKMIEQIIDDPIYNDLENINFLKAIIEFHSVPDREFNKITKKYKIKDIERFKKLAYILKDADGLDRVRLSINNKIFSDLNPKYLRIDDSFNLVKCAHILNYIVIKGI